MAALKTIRAAYEKAGFEVQTLRITTQPFPEYTRNLSGEQALANGKPLSILIEKDFKCVHADETDADAYPNPMELGARG